MDGILLELGNARAALQAWTELHEEENHHHHNNHQQGRRTTASTTEGASQHLPIDPDDDGDENAFSQINGGDCNNSSSGHTKKVTLLYDRIHHLESQLRTEGTELSQLQTLNIQMEETNKETALKSDCVHQRNKVLLEKLNGTESRLNTLLNNRSQERRLINQFTERSERLQKEIVSWKADVGVWGTVLRSLKDQVKTLSAEVEILREAKRDAEERYANAKEAASHTDELTKSVASLNLQLEQEKLQRSTAEQVIQKVNGYYERSEGTLRSMEELCSANVHNSTEASETIDRLIGTISLLESQLDGANVPLQNEVFCSKVQNNMMLLTSGDEEGEDAKNGKMQTKGELSETTEAHDRLTMSGVSTTGRSSQSSSDGGDVVLFQVEYDEQSAHLAQAHGKILDLTLSLQEETSRREIAECNYRTLLNSFVSECGTILQLKAHNSLLQTERQEVTKLNINLDKRIDMLLQENSCQEGRIKELHEDLTECREVFRQQDRDLASFVVQSGPCRTITTDKGSNSRGNNMDGNVLSRSGGALLPHDSTSPTMSRGGTVQRPQHVIAVTCCACGQSIVADQCAASCISCRKQFHSKCVGCAPNQRNFLCPDHSGQQPQQVNQQRLAPSSATDQNQVRTNHVQNNEIPIFTATTHQQLTERIDDLCESHCQQADQHTKGDSNLGRRVTKPPGRKRGGN